MTVEMVYRACATWMDDLVTSYPWPLVDAYDASTYFDEIVKDAMRLFLTHAFHTERARNDAMIVLRSLFYEHYLFQKQISQTTINADPIAPIRLEAAPQTVQKSAAWHAEAYNTLSGHEFGAICVGGPGEKMAVYVKKCNPPPPVSEDAPDSRTVYVTLDDGTLSPFKWGWRYEPVAREVYEAHYAQGTVADTLGRIRHPTLPRLGASPDGLITSGSRCGRLVELKCPSSRTLDGTIPLRYYCQMQLQAEVCDVAAVDYFEICFAAVPTLTNEHLLNAKLPYVGKLVVTADQNGQPKDYKYSPLFPATPEGIQLANAWTVDAPLLESVCWYIKDSNNDVVLRNPRWWTAVGKPAYEEFWRTVDTARVDGRYKYTPKALFIEDATTEGSVASDRKVDDNEDEADGPANDEDEGDCESDAEDTQNDA